jgi:hypothetical protein
MDALAATVAQRYREATGRADIDSFSQLQGLAGLL